MTRTASQESEPHRVLIRLDHDVQRGADIRALESAGQRRRAARGMDDGGLGRDGILTPEEFDSLSTVARYLGALESTLGQHDRGRPVLTIGVQRMIRYPGRRTDAQLARASERMAQLQEDRDKRAAAQKAHAAAARTSGGLDEKRSRARDAAMFALDNAPRHYTQGGARWDPIRSGARPGGHMWAYADCSSFATWCIWYALGCGGPDVVNGADWSAGYTGTMLHHGVAVASPSHYGDLVIYGRRGSSGAHVAAYVGNGLCVGHGSEGGPRLLPVRYRSDVLSVRRYIT